MTSVVPFRRPYIVLLQEGHGAATFLTSGWVGEMTSLPATGHPLTANFVLLFRILSATLMLITLASCLFSKFLAEKILKHRIYHEKLTGAWEPLAYVITEVPGMADVASQGPLILLLRLVVSIVSHYGSCLLLDALIRILWNKFCKMIGLF